jgi:hypothetical protein
MEPSDECDRQQDEWVSVGQVLGDGGALASRSRLGRVLRAAVLALANPEVSESQVEAIRALADALNRLADEAPPNHR